MKEVVHDDDQEHMDAMNMVLLRCPYPLRWLFSGSLNPFLTALSTSAAVHCPRSGKCCMVAFLGSLNPFELLPRIPPFGEGLQLGRAKPLAEASCHV